MQNPSRRQFMKASFCAAAAMALPLPKLALAATASKELSFYNLHTDEKLRLVFFDKGRYVPQALQAASRFLRDYRTGDTHSIDPALFDQLHRLQQLVQMPGPFHVISGYRSPKTNGFLHANSTGVAKNSMHMQGRAMDIRLPGRELTQLHNAALSMNAGGVGYYPESNFIHVDTGRVRRWGQAVHA